MPAYPMPEPGNGGRMRQTGVRFYNYAKLVDKEKNKKDCLQASRCWPSASCLEAMDNGVSKNTDCENTAVVGM